MIVIPEEVHPDVRRLASPTASVAWTVTYIRSVDRSRQSALVITREPLAESVAADLLADGHTPISIHPSGWVTSEPL